MFWTTGLPKRISMTVLAAVALSGCKVDSDFDLFVTDVFAVSESGQYLNTPTQIRIEAVSKERCEENKEAVREILSKYYPLKDPPVCQNVGLDTYVSLRVHVPVMKLPEGNFELPESAPSALGLKELPNGSVEVYGLISPSRFKLMENDFQNLNSSIRLQIGDVQITLTNDDRNPHRVFGPASWINDIPNFGPSIDVEGRERVVWKASDVAEAFLAINHFVWLMTIEP
ncbi:hypothetical protein [Aliiroseovarius sp. PrR006]|uniref:DUF7424 family protein n=1 Tax=Aliiroseovarius sp. PrR006 TaxID=2706883 RepID=UPI0013D894F3|nr:hypothetical protein [Aliiroseovarius sp. PrR006]NDW52127.1 hypothetical protein [Aliiroseovarius sp. PrR006]